MRKAKGLLITFEGTEGAGKSTLIRAVAEALKRWKRPIVVTREPGGSRVAEKIRKLILNEEMTSWTELFLYEAARAEHLAMTIQPALKKGAIVLCDRYADSSLAYQGHARGLPWNHVKTLNRLATQGVSPELTVFLDIDPTQGLARARNPNRFEAEGAAFQAKVRLGFLKARRENPSRWLTLRAQSGSPETLAARVIEALERKGFRHG